MKTILTKTIDDYTIIIGFDKPVIDPSKTKPVIEKEIKKTAEFKDIVAKKKDMANNVQMGIQARKNSKTATTEPERRKYYKEFELRQLNIEDIQKKLKKSWSAIKKKEKELIQKNAVYFEPKTNEQIVTDTAAEALKEKMNAALDNNAVIDIDGNEIKNYSGKTLCKKANGSWKSRIIDKIGIDKKPGEKVKSQLSEIERTEIIVQYEVDRISSMSPEEKSAEEAALINGAGIHAAKLRSQYEIQAEADPLAKSQEWYNKQVSEIEAKYSK